jgi:hypothetical protein
MTETVHTGQVGPTVRVVSSALFSAREAARLLEFVGVSRRRTRQLLRCGLAGPPVVAANALLYDADRVSALCRWPLSTLGELDELCPRGSFLARRYVDAEPPPADDRPDGWTDRRTDGWTDGWPLSPLTAVWIRHRVDQEGAFPFLGVVCGFITRGADITGVTLQGQSTVSRSGGSRSGGSQPLYRLELAPPGGWFESLRQHRLAAPGGKTFMVRGWPPPPVRTA